MSSSVIKIFLDLNGCSCLIKKDPFVLYSLRVLQLVPRCLYFYELKSVQVVPNPLQGKGQKETYYL